MTGRGLATYVVAAFGGIALVMAACAPAQGPQPPAQKPGEPAAKPPPSEAPKETTAPRAQPAEAGAKTAASGIPLDPGAKFGGVLRGTYEREGPTFSQWEELAAIASDAGAPLTNGVVRSRNWGTQKDYENQAYFEIAPDLARSWEQSADGLRWTFKLRDGVTWTDGQALTCADAKWSLDTIRTGAGLKRSPLGIHFIAVDTIQCPDALTMVVNLKRPKPAFLQVVGAPQVAVLPKHIYENDMDALRNKPHVAGTGPFILTEWIAGEKLTFKRKADYWDKPLPYQDGIELRIATSASANAAALRAGRLDLAGVSGFSGGVAKTLIAECKDCQVWPKTFNQGTSPVIVPNQQRPPWNDPLVKDALSLAYDRAKAISMVSGGWAVLPSGGPYLPGSYWAMPYERVKQVPGYNFETPKENKERARDLLAQAGYRPGELTVPLYYAFTAAEDAIPSLVEDLEEVGFQVKATRYDTAVYYTMASAGDFDLFVASMFDSGFDADFVMYGSFYTGAERNLGRYSNPALDRLIDEMSMTIDREARRRKAWDAGEIVLRGQAKIIGGMIGTTPVFGPRLRGYMPGPAFLRYGAPKRFDHVWLAE